ncbi:LysR family transcriptional regulator [Paraburkholderia sp. D15]|uniref:LysR family transcriptional regulator n=1 Tax=Paraburkholderia sp. D15 TaxID=2880218 RepID=UPI002478DD96|nr:LysR family transcriptional regulator [Paraburkholderia sp. D15]WGS54248.1 LysR family transcriptional regulator [Paraburkholderia sp. D15]WKF60207.1 HTH-type transcriptional regulator DmlR [Paraburkholderia busanensis]
MADLRDVNLNRLAVFVAVVEAGSLTAAAERLGLAKTMVSKHMQRLEAEVGASLLVRTTRRLNVTEAGRTFYDASCLALRAAEDGLSAIAGEVGPLRGTLRVNAPIDFGLQFVAPALVELRRVHPELEVDLQCVDQLVDLVGEGVDVAIRLGRLADSNYRAVKIGEFVKWMVASPAALGAGAAKPAELAMLADRPYVAVATLPRPLSVALEHRDGRKDSLRYPNAFLTNTATAARAATLAGGGIALLTDFSIADDVAAGRLVRLLDGWATAPANIHAIFPATRFPSRKVRALIDAVKVQWLAALALRSGKAKRSSSRA